MKSRRISLKSATALAALSLVTPTPVWADGPTPVVATFSILGDMVERIGGEHVEVTTLVGPDGDAHVYQPTPKDARSVSKAEVLFINGLEFEGWLERLSEAAGFDGYLVVATNGIDAIPFDEHDSHDDHGDKDTGADHDHDHDRGGEQHAEAEDDHGDHGHEKHAEHDAHDDHDEHASEGHAGHDHGAFDPHAWQSPVNAVIYVDNITAALAIADPANAGIFYENRNAYVAEIEALDQEIDALLTSLPEDRRTVVTSHDAFGYFADYYGLTFEAPQGLSTESEPSAADVAELITQIRDDGISAVFVESITDNRLLEEIANDTSATVGGTLYSDALSDENGPAATYLDMMRHNATTLSQALGS
ncbi:metal ABC transporter substrate-binding protein [Roseibium sp. RKSG952]|uniref:metal ABC transporter substrate-binding protein n=1 Tax=Roseibium sp. RKSG952 TaxID=2529384 RepID=UPI0012BCB23C|nr:zinc ABC transporter substrate-binding protein [Roseibium sp. RKSG952]MTH95816.1 metal ABC transporter substrate-binding protein [Roseibium sp. RKSG952]